jgi:hypothetical protein
MKSIKDVRGFLVGRFNPPELKVHRDVLEFAQSDLLVKIMVYNAIYLYPSLHG